MCLIALHYVLRYCTTIFVKLHRPLCIINRQLMHALRWLYCKIMHLFYRICAMINAARGSKMKTSLKSTLVYRYCSCDDKFFQRRQDMYQCWMLFNVSQDFLGCCCCWWWWSSTDKLLRLISSRRKLRWNLDNSGATSLTSTQASVDGRYSCRHTANCRSALPRRNAILVIAGIVPPMKISRWQNSRTLIPYECVIGGRPRSLLTVLSSMIGLW